jgi:hypothetical protein
MADWGVRVHADAVALDAASKPYRLLDWRQLCRRRW